MSVFHVYKVCENQIKNGSMVRYGPCFHSLYEACDYAQEQVSKYSSDAVIIVKSGETFFIFTNLFHDILRMVGKDNKTFFSLERVFVNSIFRKKPKNMTYVNLDNYFFAEHNSCDIKFFIA